MASESCVLSYILPSFLTYLLSPLSLQVAVRACEFLGLGLGIKLGLAVQGLGCLASSAAKPHLHAETGVETLRRGLKALV